MREKECNVISTKLTPDGFQPATPSELETQPANRLYAKIDFVKIVGY